VQRFAQRFALRKNVEKHLSGDFPTDSKDDLSLTNLYWAFHYCLYGRVCKTSYERGPTSCSNAISNRSKDRFRMWKMRDRFEFA